MHLPIMRSTLNTSAHSRSSTRPSAASRAICILIPLLVLVGSLAWPRTALGQTDDRAVTYLDVGQVAPFAGDLFPVRLSIDLGLRLERCAEFAALELATVKARHAAELRFRREAMAAKLDAERTRRAILTRELAEAGAWYRSPVFVSIVAVVATLGGVTVIGYTWGQLSR